MENMQDSTILTKAKMLRLLEKLNAAQEPIPTDEEFTISEIEENYFQVSIGFVEILNIKTNENGLIFSLKIDNYIFAKEVEYPFSELESENRIYGMRFMAFLEWQALKNIDNINLYTNPD